MSIRYIYNTSGDYVAFVQGNNLFNPNCEWIGFIELGNEVYSKDGRFIGYLLNDDRIIRNKNEMKVSKMRPLKPLRPLRPLRPMRRMRMPKLPNPYEDVFESGFDPSKVLVTESRIEGNFNGWNGDTIYELTNGQKWKQARYQYKYSYKFRPIAKIWKEGSRYYMEVDNSGDFVEVIRI